MRQSLNRGVGWDLLSISGQLGFGMRRPMASSGSRVGPGPVFEELPLSCFHFVCFLKRNTDSDRVLVLMSLTRDGDIEPSGNRWRLVGTCCPLLVSWFLASAQPQREQGHRSVQKHFGPNCAFCGTVPTVDTRIGQRARPFLSGNI